MGKWREIFMDVTSKNKYTKLNSPATHMQLAHVEEMLGNKLPIDIKELLLELNGDNWLIFSTEQIIETNLSLRKLDYYMPLDCLLFFGGNGCGDYYGYPITGEHGVRDDKVFLWEHEDDSRIWKANDLEDTIRKYYNNKI